MTTVLVAEDDPDIADSLARALEREGYEVVQVSDGAAAQHLASTLTISLVVLDIGLPSGDGLDVCRSLRENGKDIAVLMLTARTDELDVVVGLDAGADDYVAKPFRMGEVLARVRALLRRSAPERVEIGNLVLDVAGRKAFLDSVQLALAFKEFELLKLLMTNAGQVVPRERIISEIWPDLESRNSKTLDMHMSWLRRKIAGPNGSGGEGQISTIRGLGFRFNEA